MTDLAAAVFTLRPIKAGSVPHWTGLAAQAEFLKRIEQIDPAMSRAIHDHNGPKPYTTSSLMGTGKPQPGWYLLSPERAYYLRVTTLQNDLTHLLLDRLLPSLTDSTINLVGVDFQIEAITTDASADQWAGISTYADLVQQYTLQVDRLDSRIDMIFSSPTAFRSQDMTIPFPLPDLVFGNLVDRWNQFSPVKLHPDARRFAGECIAASKYDLESRFVQFEDSHRQPTVGGMGRCRYVIMNKDRYWRGLMHALAGYAFYAGVGRYTTIGLGRTRARDHVPDSDED